MYRLEVLVTRGITSYRYGRMEGRGGEREGGMEGGGRGGEGGNTLGSFRCRWLSTWCWRGSIGFQDTGNDPGLSAGGEQRGDEMLDEGDLDGGQFLRLVPVHEDGWWQPQDRLFLTLR